MSSKVIPLVEGDTLPELAVTYRGMDLTGFQAVRLHIKYSPWPLVKDAVVTDAPEGEFQFAWAAGRTTTLAQNAASGALQLVVQAADFAGLPAAGELVVDVGAKLEHVRYSSKTGPDKLNLIDPLSQAHSAGAMVKQLADLRQGKWPAEISLTNADGKTQTFAKLLLDIEPEIA